MTYDTRHISREVRENWEIFMHLGKIGWFAVHFIYRRGATL